MTTNKPKVKRYDDMGCPEQICRVDTMHESDDGDYVLYEDYEALAAECSALVEALEAALGSFDDWCEGQDPSDIADAIDTFPWVIQARTALAAYRKGGE